MVRCSRSMPWPGEAMALPSVSAAEGRSVPMNAARSALSLRVRSSCGPDTWPNRRMLAVAFLKPSSSNFVISARCSASSPSCFDVYPDVLPVARSTASRRSCTWAASSAAFDTAPMAPTIAPTETTRPSAAVAAAAKDSTSFIAPPMTFVISPMSRWIRATLARSSISRRPAITCGPSEKRVDLPVELVLRRCRQHAPGRRTVGIRRDGKLREVLAREALQELRLPRLQAARRASRPGVDLGEGKGGAAHGCVHGRPDLEEHLDDAGERGPWEPRLLLLVQDSFQARSLIPFSVHRLRWGLRDRVKPRELSDMET